MLTDDSEVNENTSAISENFESVESHRKKSLTYINTQLDKINEMLTNLHSPTFNIFELDQLVEKKTVLYMLSEIIRRFDLIGIINEAKYTNFVNVIIDGYDRNIPYHNDLHAGDVMQTTFVMMSNNELVKILQLKQIDLLAIILASVSHDFRHPGTNNNYQINAGTDLALVYNGNNLIILIDISVLENFHVSEVIKELKKAKNNFFEDLSPEESRLIRRRMIDSILATDMSYHTKTFTNFKNKIETFDIKKGRNLDKMIFSDNLGLTYENQQLILGMVIHASDISNPCKPASINKIWVDMLFVEYFNQGDIEKSHCLPISHLCDRNNTNINASQVFFINRIVMPTFKVLKNVIPHVKAYKKTIKDNLQRYENLLNDY